MKTRENAKNQMPNAHLHELFVDELRDMMGGERQLLKGLTYGCLVTYAKLMEHQEAAELLAQTLNEEKETDEKLTEIAMSEVNVSA